MTAETCDTCGEPILATMDERLACGCGVRPGKADPRAGMNRHERRAFAREQARRARGLRPKGPR